MWLLNIVDPGYRYFNQNLDFLLSFQIIFPNHDFAYAN